ncbi:TolB-like translocation protein [Hymenobacter chitinivorans]|uniref:WD40 repeat protein n=1 Tax=Hymenobacter chitinivorans DSM 11115 TaxID=1121954 RepID=A0A2M9B929_9BACT|nr:hypothetical protein [Hymenobacter chitinivorans]PJJ54428.1 hypothetical protein CLV45_2765 [Hymenobacter chitinivorans DSM 11115]
MHKYLLAALAATLRFLPAQAQPALPVLPQNPAALRWQQVRTPHFQVLFPENFAAQAQRTALRLEQVYGPVSASLEKEPRPITVVLQNQTTVGNGFVTLIPRHSEFFTTPPQDPFLAGTLGWLDLLAVHEDRHVVQYEKGQQGLGRLAYQLFGYAGLGTVALGIPDWFWEGDAVGTETLLTRSGRGRIPYFDLGLRANLLAGRHFSYSKAVAGSFRDNVPNHYVLGYFMTTNFKRRRGPTAWSDVLNRYYRFPIYPFSFSDKLRLSAGGQLRTDDLYARTMTELDSLWRARQQELKLTPVTPFQTKTEPGVFTEYQYPQYVDDNTVLAVKSGLGDISQLVLLRRDAPEKRVFVQGLFNNPEMLSVGGGKACWPEFRPGVRWGQQVYSDLRVLDLQSGQLTRLTSRQRYTNAALSPDGRLILAVRATTDYQNQLVVLDAATGQEKRVLPNPTNDFYQQPRWRPDNRSIVVVTLQPAGKMLESIDTETGQHQTLVPAANVNLSHPQPWGDYVLFNSPQSGIDNVYAVDTRSGQVRQVTARPLGAYHAAVSPDGRHLAFHDFRAEGAQVVEMPLQPELWPVAAPAPARPAAYTDPLLSQEPGTRTIGTVLPDSSVSAATPLAVTPYHRLSHAFNTFSWGIIQAPTGQAFSVGVRSQDLLNTTQAVVAAGYDGVERTANVSANVSYQGLYPVLDAGFQRGGRHLTRDGATDSWTYNRFTAGARLPFNLTRSKYQQALTLGAYYSGELVQGYNLPTRRITEVGFGRSLHALNGTLAYSHVLKQSKRDVAPRWGQALTASWRDTPFSTGLQARQWAAFGSLYLPGAGKHHSLRLRAGYQQQDRDPNPQKRYDFSPAVFYPRGEGYVSFNKLLVSSVEYRLPLADTDWELGRVLYVQRVKAMGFFDAAVGRSTGASAYQTAGRTAGLDVTFVFNPLRLRTPLEAGFRTIYNVRTGVWQVQPLVLDIGF